ncbi:hypothetical protein HPB49_017831 [Dermacentor silvarum]|uniref:Uncharacterized protein n=1 Tax=Dermacentor silvarum TaxID=543639 RepID=A0ACB8DEI6_DERSI|nr:hypothetical protein HPB49_017831 [Dermacentor silvarum]
MEHEGQSFAVCLSGGERPKSEPPGGRAAIKKSASQEEARAARALPSSRSVDQGDLRRLQALGQVPSPAQGSPLQHHETAQPQQQPPEPPARNWSPQLTSGGGGGGGRYPTRAVSVDRATSSSSSSLLSRWRQVGRSKSASISEPREYPLDDGNAKPTPPPRPPRSAASRLSANSRATPTEGSRGRRLRDHAGSPPPPSGEIKHPSSSGVKRVHPFRLIPSVYVASRGLSITPPSVNMG